MGLLFDTPGLSIPSASTSTSSPAPSANNKRKRPSSSHNPATTNTGNGSKESAVEVNLGKLMKKMRKMEKDSGWGGKLGEGGKSGVEANDQAVHGKPPKKGATIKAKKERKAAEVAAGGASKPKPTRFEPAKKDKRQSKKPAFSPASSSNLAYSLHEPVEQTLDLTPLKSTRHSAPTSEDASTSSVSAGAPQTAMQVALRAKLAGGRFRLLNESLYTSTGEEAWSTMKEEGAFDDYHAGFRSQAAHWPTHPLAILTKSLATLSPSTLIADFGCGDAALARSLTVTGQKVISFDLVSKDGWVVEAECSSVPLPGSRDGSEGGVVDCVVCCLSLMGTDWVEMVREARRILVQGGALRIAEVTSRFNDLDAFIALISLIGFELTHKDTKNTHFVMFDFEKTSEGEGSNRSEVTKKSLTLLKPCIYKKR